MTTTCKYWKVFIKVNCHKSIFIDVIGLRSADVCRAFYHFYEENHLLWLPVYYVGWSTTTKISKLKEFASQRTTSFPAGRGRKKLRRVNVNATWWPRIDDDTTSFGIILPSGLLLKSPMKEWQNVFSIKYPPWKIFHLSHEVINVKFQNPVSISIFYVSQMGKQNGVYHLALTCSHYSSCCPGDLPAHNVCFSGNGIQVIITIWNMY